MSSATGAIERASSAGGRRRCATVSRDAVGDDADPRRPRLARAPRRPARRHPPHRRGRLPARSAATRSPPRPEDGYSRSPSSGSTTARCRRTWSTTRGRATSWRCAARSAAGSCGTPGHGGPLLLVAGGSGRRAADGRCCATARSRAATRRRALLLSARDARRRASTATSWRRSAPTSTFTYTRARARRLDGLRPPGRPRDARRGGVPARPSARASTCAGRPRFVEAVAADFVALGHDTDADPDRALRRDRRMTMDEPIALDGNAVAGLLGRGVRASSATTAMVALRGLRARGPARRARPSTPTPRASWCAAAAARRADALRRASRPRLARPARRRLAGAALGLGGERDLLGVAGRDDAVAAGALGVVERRVGGAEQRLERDGVAAGAPRRRATR